MPFHDITQLPTGISEPNSAALEALSANDRIQITELLHRIYLCEDSRDCCSDDTTALAAFSQRRPNFKTNQHHTGNDHNR